MKCVPRVSGDERLCITWQTSPASAGMIHPSLAPSGAFFLSESFVAHHSSDTVFDDGAAQCSGAIPPSLPAHSPLAFPQVQRQ